MERDKASINDFLDGAATPVHWIVFILTVLAGIGGGVIVAYICAALGA